MGSDDWERIAVKATDCPRISKEFLEEERGCMGEVWFAQEYLCEFVENGRNLFGREVIEDSIDGDVEVLRLDVRAPLKGFEARRGHLTWW